MKTYSLALWWWAARWLAHIWVIKYLEEKQIQIDEVAGTSMWAIVAALLATWKNSQKMQEFAKSLNFLKLIDPEFKTGLLKWNKIEAEIKKIFWDSLIEETKIPLKIIATNIETSKYRVFTSGKIVDALRASISLPWIFIPKKIDWESYVDGWIMMNLPIEILSWENVIAISALKVNLWKIETNKTIIWINFKSWFFKNNYEIIKRSVILMMKANENNSLQTIDKNIKYIQPDFWWLDAAHFNKVDEFMKIWYKHATKLDL